MIRLVALLLALGLLRPALAAAQGSGSGLLAEYYAGIFERRLLVRRDAAINFDWAHQAPGPGIPPEYFSVRWTGTLLPPASGRYVFHLTADDGMRVWLDDKLLFDEWREQPVTQFVAAATLVGGRPYRLRVEYFNSILDTRARLTWERPDRPVPAPEPPSLTNGYGLFSKTAAARDEVIAGRFLGPPRPVRVVPPAAEVPKLAPAALPPAQPLPGIPPRNPTPVATGGPPRRPVASRPVAAVVVPVVVTPVVVVPPRPVAASAVAPPAVATDSVAGRVAALTNGQAILLPELLFAQGSAVLPPTAGAVLDELAAALRLRPALRLVVEGHTDNVGDAGLNQQLSRRRAAAVCRYLVAHGVPGARLRPVGYGGTRPIADNSDPVLRPGNRRVVLVMAK